MFFLSKFRKTLNSICIGIDYDDNYEEQYQLLLDVTNSDMEEDSDQTVFLDDQLRQPLVFITTLDLFDIVYFRVG